jgi:hypothetical protein
VVGATQAGTQAGGGVRKKHLSFVVGHFSFVDFVGVLDSGSIA